MASELPDFWTLPGVPVNEDELQLLHVLSVRLGMNYTELQRHGLHLLCLQHRDALAGDNLAYPQRTCWLRRTIGRPKAAAREPRQLDLDPVPPQTAEAAPPDQPHVQEEPDPS